MANEITNEIGPESGANGRREMDANTSVVTFHKSKAKEFIITGCDHVGVTLYKELKVMFRPMVDTIDLNKVKSNIIKNVKKVILSTSQDDIKLYEDASEIVSDRMNLALTALIPYSDRMNLVVSNVSRLIGSLNGEIASCVKYKTNLKSIAWIGVNKGSEKNPNCFIKGFAAVSHNCFTKIDGSEVENNSIRCATFLSNDLGFNIKDLINFNNHNMSLNRVYIYGLPDEGKNGVQTYTIPFNRSFKLVLYKIQNCNTDTPNFLMLRNEITYSLKFRTDATTGKKIAVGCYIKNIETVKEIENFKSVFVDESGKWILSNDKYIGFNEKSYEANTFKREIDIIDEYIYSTFSKEDDSPEEVVEASTEAAAPAPEKSKKSKKNKKKEKEPVAEEVSEAVTEETTSEAVTEEVSETTEATFNDVGTLVDDDESDETTVDAGDNSEPVNVTETKE
jgi:hypothetical protein